MSGFFVLPIKTPISYIGVGPVQSARRQRTGVQFLPSSNFPHIMWYRPHDIWKMNDLQLNRLIKRMRDVLRMDPGVDGDAQRLAQISWMLFFKAASQASSQASFWPENAPTWWDYRERFAFKRDGIVAYTNEELLPRLKEAAQFGSQSLREIINDFKNYATSDDLLGELLDITDRLPVDRVEDRHLVGDFYERMLSALQNAGTAGEFYTPRALTRLMAEIVAPKEGETLIDPASGTGGFLISALQQLDTQRTGTKAGPLLQVYGIEKKALPHLLCATNLLLHGHYNIEHIHQRNMLATYKAGGQESGKFDIVITNPPFGGEEEPGVEANFPTGYRTRETSLLFILFAIDCLKSGGRAAIVMPDGFLFGDGTAARVRQKLLTECDVHTVLRLPSGVFAPYTSIKSNVVIFEKGTKTQGVWFYQHVPANGSKGYSKTRPITFDELAHIPSWCNARAERSAIEHSFFVPIDEIEKNRWSLDYKNDHVGQFDLSALSNGYFSSLDGINATCSQIKRKLESWSEVTDEHCSTLLKLLPYLSQTLRGVESIERAVLALAMTGRLTAKVASHSRAAHASDSLGNGPPAGWETIELGTLGRIVGGATPRADDPANFATDGGIPWITPADLRGVRSKHVDGGRRRLSQVGYSSCSTEILPPGTVLFSSRAPIGYVAIVKDELCTNQGFKSIIPNDIALSDFLYYFLKFRTPEIDRTAPGTTFKEISGSRMKTVQVWLPPIEERQLLVRRLDEIQEDINILLDRARDCTQSFNNICDALTVG